MSIEDWIGAVGVTLILVAFLLNLGGLLGRESRLYLLLNLVGAALACLASLLIPFWPFVVLEGVWAAAALIGLSRVRRVAVAT
jgi:hypothetical protein